MTCFAWCTDPYPIEVLPSGWVTAAVTLRHQNGKQSERYEILDIRSCEIDQAPRYLHEPMRMIALKCLILFLTGVPLYFLIYEIYQLIRTPIASLFHFSPSTFLKEIGTIARMPIFFLGLQCAALYGIIYPLEGRALFAKIESSFHGGKGLHEAWQYRDTDSDEGPLCPGFLDKDPEEAVFVGFCMQPIGRLSDPHIESVLIVDQTTQDV